MLGMDGFEELDNKVYKAVSCLKMFVEKVALFTTREEHTIMKVLDAVEDYILSHPESVMKFNSFLEEREREMNSLPPVDGIGDPSPDDGLS